MRSNLPFIQHRLKLMLAEGPSTAVTVRWNTVAGGTLDKTTGAMVGGAVTPHTLAVKAFAHLVSATTAIREYQEVETGDAILEFDADVVLEGAGIRDVVFEFNGGRWEQKPISDRLVKMWDVTAMGLTLTRSLVVRKVS